MRTLQEAIDYLKIHGKDIGRKADKGNQICKNITYVNNFCMGYSIERYCRKTSRLSMFFVLENEKGELDLSDTGYLYCVGDKVKIKNINYIFSHGYGEVEIIKRIQ